MKIKTVVVEDEALGQKVINGILKNYCADLIDICAITATVKESVKAIKDHAPQLVFLDIKLGTNEQGAFDILKEFGNKDFKVVFTTSSEQKNDFLNALNTFNARKYLLKPLDIDQVIDAVNLINEEIQNNQVSDEIEEVKRLIREMHVNDETRKIKVPVNRAVKFIPCNEIVMVRSQQNVAYVFLEDGESIKSSKNLSYFKMLLPSSVFTQTSRSYLVNINHVDSYTKDPDCTIQLTANCEAPLTDSYKDAFFRLLEG